MKKIILKLLIVYVSLIIIFLLLLLLVSFIPRNLLKDNIAESVEIMKEQGEQFYIKSFFKDLLIHNSTDSIMLNLSYSIDEKDNIKYILANQRNYVPNSNQIVHKEDVGNLKHEYANFSMINELDDTLNERNVDSYSYAKYWHGYLVIIRVLLLFFNIEQIRFIFFAVLIILAGILIYELEKKIDKKLWILYIIGLCSIDFFVFVFEIQGVFPVLLGLLFSIIVVKAKDIKRDNYFIILFILGGLIAYLDFLTTPLLGMLLPIITKNLLDSNKLEEKSYFKIIRDFIVDLVVLVFAYFSLWFGKWIIVDIFYNTDVIKKAFEEIIFRLDTNKQTMLGSIFINAYYSINLYVLLIFCTVEILFMYNIIKYKRVITKSNIVFLLCSITVILYYLIVAGHSQYHYFFTYKTMNMFYMSLLLFTGDFEKDGVRGDIDKK